MTCSRNLILPAFFASYRDVKLGLAGLPTFHMMGVSWQVCSPLYSVSPIAVHAPQFPESPVVPHPQNVLEVAKLTECTGIITIPSFVEVRVSMWEYQYLKLTFDRPGSTLPKMSNF